MRRRFLKGKNAFHAKIAAHKILNCDLIIAYMANNTSKMFFYARKAQIPGAGRYGLSPPPAPGSHIFVGVQTLESFNNPVGF
jgi:hypothetical protein